MPKLDCEKHRNIRISNPVCVVCMNEEIEQLRDALIRITNDLENCSLSEGDDKSDALQLAKYLLDSYSKG